MRRLFCAAAAVALSGCWVPAERGRQMERRIDRLEQEDELNKQQLEQQRELVRDRVAKVDTKIAEVQKKLDELNTAAHRSGADVVAQQDQLQADVASLRGQLEESQHRLQQLEQQLALGRKQDEERFAALRGAGALDQLETRRKLEALKKPSEPQPFLALAREQDKAGEKAVARDLYDEYVRRWPRDPGAADALFRTGELAAEQGRHRDAVLAFGKVAQDYPRAERAPDAMLQTADSLVALSKREEKKDQQKGLVDAAVGVLRELREKYPKSAAATAAKKRLDELEPPRKPQAGSKSAPKKKKKR
jgi:TolA-binding protein